MVRGGSSGSLNDGRQIVLRCRTKEDRARSFRTRTPDISAPLSFLPYNGGPTGSTGLAVLLPRLALRMDRRAMASRTLDARQEWRDWSWGLERAGLVHTHLDPVLGSVLMVGEVRTVPLAEQFATVIDRGFVSLVCLLCGGNLSANALLVADVRGGGVRIGCTRCLPPPPGENAPTPAEVRASLEATSWGAGR